MILSVLIKKGGLTGNMTATLATPATQEADKPVTVAPVATVAVAAKPKPLPELLPDQEASIRVWLANIDEIDPEIITEVLKQCRNETGAHRYFLKRSDEVPKTVHIRERVTCGDCTYYERIEHPHLGHCTKGESEAIAGLWDSDRRYCELYFTCSDKTTEVQTDAMKVKIKS